MALKTCKKGHQFTKTSDCPVCPICEEENKPREGFLATLAASSQKGFGKQWDRNS